MLNCCRTLKVEVYRLNDESLLQGWVQFKCPDYAGKHGMLVPIGEGKP